MVLQDAVSHFGKCNCRGIFANDFLLKIGRDAVAACYLPTLRQSLATCSPLTIRFCSIHRFFSLLFSSPYKTLFSQIPSFHIYAKRPGVCPHPLLYETSAFSVYVRYLFSFLCLSSDF